MTYTVVESIVQADLVDPEGHEYRNYTNSAFQDRVARHYKRNHEQQTVQVGKEIQAQLLHTKQYLEMSLMEAMEVLDAVMDESDPDTDLTQVLHAYQTAEEARRRFPNEEWIHVAGLIHDAGKVLCLKEFGGYPQQFVTGDTFPLGCAFNQSIVMHDYFKGNPDAQCEAYQSPVGMYSPNCGLRNLLMSFGHDEYLYQVLKTNQHLHSLNEEAMYIIRFHSFYAHHQHNSYSHLCDDYDTKMLDVLKRFQPCDLYSKTEELPDVPALQQYYGGLLSKYGLDAKLKWPVLDLPDSLRHLVAAAATSDS